MAEHPPTQLSGPEPTHAPTVQEVSVSAFWNPLEGIMAAEVGSLTNTFRQEFPKLSEAPVMPPWPGSKSLHRLPLLNEPPQRSWQMATESNDGLIRFQFDRIIFSWLRSSSGGSYPGYANMRSKLAYLIGAADEWLADKVILGTGSLAEEIRQVQVDYVNQVDISSTSLLRGLVSGWHEAPSVAPPEKMSRAEADLFLDMDQPDRDETIINVASDGMAGSLLKVTCATIVEESTDYLAALDQAHANYEEASSLVIPN